MIDFQNRLEGIKPLLFSLLFFLMLLMGAWFSYSLLKKYRKKYGEKCTATKIIAAVFL